MCKGIPVHTTIDNNDRVQEILTGKGTTHDTNMTLFQSICEGLFLSLFESLFDLRVKRTVCSIAISLFCRLF